VSERVSEVSFLGTLELFTAVFHFGKETFSVDLLDMNISIKKNIQKKHEIISKMKKGKMKMPIHKKEKLFTSQ
jgi:chloramphenicol O-acetyltransferase